ncbi:MAG: site-2 protease family protein [Candidatus Paracaedimonas acanthamoebae]|uniref:Site-2 protease family protein n=1 Tax=Candidatus Paracaedimonas acanthamoebae TaxID=244581 RepID=A0A8J7PRK6_9PROT|nr:site-2 protease family protein [Candidatus Paracaedimonas acanthamoebae]
MLSELFFKILMIGLPVMIAITFHEAAHGFVAYLRGDDTAYRLGRVSFNPIRHIDPVGTLLIPGILLLSQAPFLFGYAKPVPVVFERLKNPRLDTIWVAAAGPLTNILLAILSAFILKNLTTDSSFYLIEMMKTSLYINVILAAFNLLPILPLDGGRIVVALLPQRLAQQISGLERWSMAILIGGLMILPLVLTSLGIHFSPMMWLLEGPIDGLLKGIEFITR